LGSDSRASSATGAPDLSIGPSPSRSDDMTL